MSTDLQQFSTENQLDTIRRATRLPDHTRFLSIDGRDGLNSLMLEVQFGTADFQAILVYDVSRWGRFQDAD
jgi:DNA invertase Pin-like site-specific DNA recombinase